MSRQMTKGSSVKSWGTALKAVGTQRVTYSIIGIFSGRRRPVWLERNKQVKE